MRISDWSADVCSSDLPRDADDWCRIAEACVGVGVARCPDAPALDELRRRCSDAMDVAAFYDAFPAQGLAYGPAFRSVVELRQGDGAALARLVLPDGLEAGGFRLSPASLYCCFPSRVDRAPGVPGQGSSLLKRSVLR